jgi:hypothetical protein
MSRKNDCFKYAACLYHPEKRKNKRSISGSNFEEEEDKRIMLVHISAVSFDGILPLLGQWLCNRPLAC